MIKNKNDSNEAFRQESHPGFNEEILRYFAQECPSLIRLNRQEHSFTWMKNSTGLARGDFKTLHLNNFKNFKS